MEDNTAQKQQRNKRFQMIAVIIFGVLITISAIIVQTTFSDKMIVAPDGPGGSVTNEYQEQNS